MPTPLYLRDLNPERRKEQENYIRSLKNEKLNEALQEEEDIEIGTYYNDADIKVA